MGFRISSSDVAAIKAKTDNLPTDPADQSEVNAQIAATNVLVNSVWTDVNALQVDVTAIETTVTAVKAKTDLIPADIATQMDTNVPAIKAKTDNLPTDPADQSAVEAEIRKGASKLVFMSDIDDMIDLSTPAADVNLPDVVVAGIPAGAALLRVEVFLKVRILENTNASANAINGAQNIRIKKSTGAWGVDDVAAINLPDNLWSLAASARESGDVLWGDNDVKSEVDGNATYNLRFEDSLVDGAVLRLNDILVGIIVYFTTG